MDDMITCGRLVVVNGELAVSASKNIASLQVGTPAPGVRSWIITTTCIPEDPVFEAVTLFGKGLFGSPDQDYFSPLLRVPLTITPCGPGLVTVTFEVLITDENGDPIDPCSIGTTGPFCNVLIPFALMRCGPDLIFATPTPG